MRIHFVLAGLVLCSGRELAAQQPSQPVAAETRKNISVAFRFLTLGLGGEVARLLTDHVAARVGANYFKLSTTKTQSDITYDASLKLHAVSVLIDLYPGRRGSFHFTGGILTNPLTIDATGQPTSSGTFTMNGNTYTTAQVGALTAEGKYPGVSPYVGLGFGTPASKGGGLAFLFDLGAAIGKPTITLTASGSGCAAGTQCGNDLQPQADTTQHDVRKYAKVYPVLSFGLAYRF
ncbi:MAG: hypothetical protein DMD53_07545 [Gemmatimonadetes bacterium]|nr:MAG: hypothetical protein DMD53_07545 [Gemmatimonadota bacterium]